ncbi:hypothetical protein V8C86DRAFT_2472175 [Haematococcus lacustris]
MPRGVAKENLPSKTCLVCKRPFTWRKVWERCWDEVLTCSDRCKSDRKKLIRLEKQAGGKQPAPGPAAAPDSRLEHPCQEQE